jgi:hypothetical protein
MGIKMAKEAERNIHILLLVFLLGLLILQAGS